MSVELHEQAGGKVLQVQISGHLTKDDYEKFVPRAEGLLKRNGKLRMLVEMKDFHGWSLGGVWEDVKFDIKHFSDLERVALVGDSKWEAGMSVFCKPFTAAAVRYFDQSKAAEADQWIHEGILQPV